MLCTTDLENQLEDNSSRSLAQEVERIVVGGSGRLDELKGWWLTALSQTRKHRKAYEEESQVEVRQRSPREQHL